MSEGLNKVQLIGNLGVDGELRVTQSGQAVLKLRLACTDRYKDRDGTWQERTEWVRCTVWGKRAEALGKIVQKGSSLYIEGRLQTSSYEKNGEKKYSTEVVADKVLLLGGKGDRSENASGGQRRPAPADDGAGDAAGEFSGGGATAGASDDSDIPF